MCSICHQIPCHHRCPNAPEAKPIMKCIECGEGIYADDEYYDTGCGGICKECMEEKTVSEMLDLFGEKFSIAS